MKTSRILVAWLLSVAVFGVFFYLTFFAVEAPRVLDEFWWSLTEFGTLSRYIQSLSLLEATAIFLTLICPSLTLSFAIFAHVVRGGIVISLRGIMLGVTVAAICLAFMVEGANQTSAVAFCAFSALVTFGGLAWLCWQGRRAGSDGDKS
jgi:hypothetical protein